MNVINPIALLFALLAVPIVLLYLLRLQRREQHVSSTLLWQQVTLDREANTLWQRLRRNLLLLFQLLTLAFLVFALIRPFFYMPSALSGRLVVLLDGSASMRAIDVLPTRFDAAKAQVRKLIDELGPDNEMSLILVDGSPHALTGATSNKGDLQAALDLAQPSLVSANWSAGIALASASGGGNAGETGVTTIILSDGSNADDLRLITGNARYIPIGSSTDNIAISTLSLRTTTRGMSALVRATNTGPTDDRVLISLRSDNMLIDARTLNVPAGQSTTWTINGIDPKTPALHATIEQAAHDMLPVDNVAYVANTTETSRRALLLTKGNRFLEQALSVLPNLRVTRAITPPVESDSPYDLYVLDGISMTLPPRANVFFLGTQSTFSTSGAFSNTAFVRAEDHLLLHSVDWRSVNAIEVQRVNTPAWLKPIVESQGGTMLFAGEMPGETSPFGRVVLLPFDLQRSDLPLQVAFPVLVANAVDWLAPPQGLNIPTSVKPGDVIPLPRETIVLMPNGQRVGVDQRGFAQTDQLGIYTAQYKSATSSFAVNFSNPAESRIAPHPELQVGGTLPSAQNLPQYSQREIWPWLAAGALVLLLVEWWIYQRGLPALRRVNKGTRD